MWIKPEGNKDKWLFLFLFAVVIVVVFFAINFITPNPESLLKKGRQDFDRGHYSLAKEKLRKVINMSPKSSGLRYEAQIFYATSFVRENKFEEGAKELRQFINDYPNSFWTPQAYFDLAYCEINLGNWPSAFQVYQKIISDFPATSWAKYSKDRLKEFEDKFKGL
jgi:TolA-binding protein